MATKKLKIKCLVPVRRAEFVCEIPAGYDSVRFRSVIGTKKIYAIAIGEGKQPIERKISPKISKHWRKICQKN